MPAVPPMPRTRCGRRGRTPPMGMRQYSSSSIDFIFMPYFAMRASSRCNVRTRHDQFNRMCGHVFQHNKLYCNQMGILLSGPLGNATWPRSNSDSAANGIEHCLIMACTLGVVICHQKHGHMTSHCCLTTSICSRTFELIKSSMFRTQVS